MHVGVQFIETDPPTPIVEPITLADAKLFLRVTVPDEDALIERLITAARTFCEQRTQRPIVPRVGDVFYDAISPGQWITLPFSPVSEVTRVTMTDATGTASVIDPSAYLVDLASDPPRIGLPSGTYWPFPLRAFQAIAIRLVIGYIVVPEDLLQAMRLLLGHYYESRTATQSGHIIATLPLGVDELLAPYEFVLLP